MHGDKFVQPKRIMRCGGLLQNQFFSRRRMKCNFLGGRAKTSPSSPSVAPATTKIKIKLEHLMGAQDLGWGEKINNNVATVPA